MVSDLVAWGTLITQRLQHREDGQGLVEYALIIGLVSVVLVVALTALAGGITNAYTTITTTLNGVGA